VAQKARAEKESTRSETSGQKAQTARQEGVIAERLAARSGEGIALVEDAKW